MYKRFMRFSYSVVSTEEIEEQEGIKESYNYVASGLPKCDEENRKLRRRLNWFKLSTFDKVKCRKRYIFKMCVQLSKILFITLQILCLMYFRNSISLYEKNIIDATNELFFQSKYSNEKSNSIYNREKLENFIISIYNNHNKLYNNSLKNISFDRKDSFLYCINVYPFTQNLSDLNNTKYKVGKNCIKIIKKQQLKQHIDLTLFSNIYYRITSYAIHIEYSMKHFSQLKFTHFYHCVKIYVDIIFDNYQNSGIIHPKLITSFDQYQCDNHKSIVEVLRLNIWIFLFNISFISISILSSFLSLRSIIANINLFKNFKLYFLTKRNYQLNFEEKCEFFNSWLIIYLINDVLSVISSCIFNYNLLSESYFGSLLSILVGTNGFLIWIGILRYLIHFESYSFLLLMIKYTTATVLRFLLCTIVIYIGVAICGYVTLSPYHEKYSTFVQVSASLFGLMNGDEVYETYQQMSESSLIMLIFFKIYVSIFILFFMYVVISVLIAILNDYSESMKYRDKNNAIIKFIDECNCALCTLRHNRHPVS